MGQGLSMRLIILHFEEMSIKRISEDYSHNDILDMDKQTCHYNRASYKKDQLIKVKSL